MLLRWWRMLTTYISSAQHEEQRKVSRACSDSAVAFCSPQLPVCFDSEYAPYTSVDSVLDEACLHGPTAARRLWVHGQLRSTPGPPTSSCACGVVWRFLFLCDRLLLADRVYLALTSTCIASVNYSAIMPKFDITRALPLDGTFSPMS